MQSNNVLHGSSLYRSGYLPSQRETEWLRVCRSVFVEVEVVLPKPLSRGSNVPAVSF